MPRRLLDQKATGTNTEHSLASLRRNTRSKSLDPVQVSRLLAKKRSPVYVDAMSKLDAGDTSQAFRQAEELICKIQEELPEIEMYDRPLGIVAKCYLGDPFEVHTLDVEHAIIQHYKRHQPLPGNLEQARALANHEAYAFVEVYATALRAVKADGTIATIRG